MALRFIERITILIVLAMGFDSVDAQTLSATNDIKTVALTEIKSVVRETLPTPLEDAEARRYSKIFELQEKGKWSEAEILTNAVKNKLLFGHIKFQRYMHPTSGRTDYKDLRNWLDVYNDHPGANRLYKLALRRKPKAAKSPKRPIGVTGLSKVISSSNRTVPRLKSPVGKSRYVIKVQRQVKSLVTRGRPTQARKLITSKTNLRLFDPVSFDESIGDIARGYFHAGKDKEALEVALLATERSGIKAPMAHWWGGLAAWRLGEFLVAGQLFEALAHSETQAGGTTSAAAFWAARAYWVGRQPQHYNRMMEIASHEQRTFYGMLAIHALGRKPLLDWELPKLDAVDYQLLTRIPATNRALALIQAGQLNRAETELRRLNGNIAPQLARSLLVLANTINLPALTFNLGTKLLQHNGELYQAALYPIPAWKPEKGFTIDRALIYALIRQESNFRTNAKSRVGARGLMQLMPSTAGFMAGKRFRGSERDKLFDPQYNIGLGQQYVHHLMATPEIGTNLFLVTAAYNGGPGNLNKWEKRINYNNDPLLFIESLPVRETRIFVEHILTNLWLYRYQLGQKTPSLTAILEGSWPQYTGLDKPQPNSSIIQSHVN